MCHLGRIFSDNEDTVFSTFIYDEKLFGHIDVNWCDSSYRKPISELEIYGELEKFIKEHSIKIFLDKANHRHGLRKGWNTLYITDVFNNVPFTLEEMNLLHSYTILQKVSKVKNESLSTFDSAASTLNIVEKIKLGK